MPGLGQTADSPCPARDGTLAVVRKVGEHEAQGELNCRQISRMAWVSFFWSSLNSL